MNARAGVLFNFNCLSFVRANDVLVMPFAHTAPCQAVLLGISNMLLNVHLELGM